MSKESIIPIAEEKETGSGRSLLKFITSGSVDDGKSTLANAVEKK